MQMGSSRPAENPITIAVRVKPNAKKPGIALDGETVEVRVRELPIEGRANEAVRDALAAALGIPRSRVELARGPRSKAKAFSIEGLSRATVFARLRAAAAAYLPHK
jgi:uncharacterized protein YggU (UPF0235/DUF167 family)